MKVSKNMNTLYKLFQEAAEKNNQLYTLLRFAARCDHVTAVTLNSYESVVAFLAAKNSVIRVANLATVNSADVDILNNIASEFEVDLRIEMNNGEIESTDLLYIDSPGEGNYRAMELSRYAPNVKKYILMPNTVLYAHEASPKIQLADSVQPIGLVYGINHFLQLNDDWFILEHDDLPPGMTVLVNKKNVTN